MGDNTLAQLHKEKANRLNIGIHYDTDPSNPMEEFDGQWTLVPFKRGDCRYMKGAKDAESVFYVDTVDWNRVPNLGIRRKLQVGLAFMLSHQPYNGTWTVQRFSPKEDTEDLCDSDGILIWEHSVSEIGAKTYEDRYKDAKACIETYNSYLTGDVYGFSVEMEDGETLDSCWGFYGPDPGYMFEEIRSAIKGYMGGGWFASCEVVSEEDYKEMEEEEGDFGEGVLYLVLTGDAKDMAEWKYSVIPEEKKIAA